MRPGLLPVAVALLLVAFGLRAFRLGDQGVWLDEAFGIHQASQPFTRIAANVASDAHPPLYYYLLGIWVRLAGTTEYAARFLSTMLSLATCAAALALGRRLVGPAVGLFALLTIGLSPFLVYYAQEVRMYALLGLAAVLATHALLRLRETESAARIAQYGLAVALLMYSHYYGAFLLPVHAIVGLSRGWLLGVALGGLLFAPWVAATAQLYVGYAAGVADVVFSEMLARTTIAFATGHGVERLTANSSDPTFAADRQLGLALAAPFAYLALVGVLWLRRTRAGAATLLVLSVVVPFALLYAASVGRRDVTPRYLMPSAPFFLLLVGAGLAAHMRAHRLLGAAAAAVVLAACALPLWNTYSVPRFWRDDVRGAAGRIASAAEPGAAVVANAFYAHVPLRYYLGGGWHLYGLPPSHPPDPGVTTAALADLAARHDEVWLFLWQDYYSDPGQVVERWLGGTRCPWRSAASAVASDCWRTRPARRSATRPACGELSARP